MLLNIIFIAPLECFLIYAGNNNLYLGFRNESIINLIIWTINIEKYIYY